MCGRVNLDSDFIRNFKRISTFKKNVSFKSLKKIITLFVIY